MRQGVKALTMFVMEEGSSRHWIINTEIRRVKFKIDIIISSKFGNREKIFLNLRNMKHIV